MSNVGAAIMITQRGHPTLLSPKGLAAIFQDACRLYADFVNADIEKGRNQSLYAAIDQQIIGDENFVDEVKENIDKVRSPYMTRAMMEQFLFSSLTPMLGYPGAFDVSAS